LQQQLKTQKLKTFLELSSKIYLDLVNFFYGNIKFNGGLLKSSVEGFQMEITKQAWMDVAGLRQSGAQVRNGELFSGAPKVHVELHGQWKLDE